MRSMSGEGGPKFQLSTEPPHPNPLPNGERERILLNCMIRETHIGS
jgi:hypothetical protein